MIGIDADGCPSYIQPPDPARPSAQPLTEPEETKRFRDDEQRAISPSPCPAPLASLQSNVPNGMTDAAPSPCQSWRREPVPAAGGETLLTIFSFAYRLTETNRCRQVVQ